MEKVILEEWDNVTNKSVINHVKHLKKVMRQVKENLGDNIILINNKRKRSKVNYFEEKQSDEKEDGNFKHKYRYHKSCFDNDRYEGKNVKSKEKNVRTPRKAYNKVITKSYKIK